MMRTAILMLGLVALGACSSAPPRDAPVADPPPAVGVRTVSTAAPQDDLAPAAAGPALDTAPFPTRVFTDDAIVTLHSPTVAESWGSSAVQLATAVEVYVDADGRSYAGVAQIPATLIAVDGGAPLLSWQRERIALEFPGLPGERLRTVREAATLAFARRPALAGLDEVAGPATVRRLAPLADSRALVIRRSDSAAALGQMRRREALRREPSQRVYERLTTDPRAAPAPVTPRQRYFDRTRRLGPTLGPSRGLYRGGIGRR
jgi:hypothetical protein